MGENAKHTPGPWAASGNYVDTADRKHGIAACCTATEEYHDNARLIAAAPEMLRDLELANTMLNFLYGITDDDAPNNVDHGRIRLTIEKAKGV